MSSSLPSRNPNAETRPIVFRSFRLHRDEDALLIARAERLGVTVSELIRRRLARDLRDTRKAA